MWIVSGLVSIVTFLVYLPSLGNGFVNWDDGQYIYENPFIRSLDANFFTSAFLEFHASNWHPLAWMSHAIDYALWGLDPFGHHLTSNILHSVNTYLVAYLVMWIMVSVRPSGPEAPIAAAAARDREILTTGAISGVLFGVHPLHVESVAWVSERKDLLCALFFLLSVLAYATHATKDSRGTDHGAGQGRLPGRNYFMALVLFFLALLSKPMAVSLPVVLLILDWHPFGRIRTRRDLWARLGEKLPFIALSLASSVVTLLAQSSGEAVTPAERLPFLTRGLVAVDSLVGYLRKMVVPLDLVPLYPYPTDVDFLSLKYLSSVAIVVGITVACVMVSRRERSWLTVWSCYVATLVPVLGLVQVGIQPMADRYTYIPSIAPFYLVGSIGASILQKVDAKRIGKRLPVIGLGLAALIGAGLLSYVTFRQISVWKSGSELWSYVIDREPGKVPLAHSNLAEIYLSIGQRDAAIRHYRMAVEIAPNDPRYHNNLGTAYISIGQSALAAKHFEAALALRPDYPDARYNLGNLYMAMGRPDLAIPQYQAALRFRKDDARIYHNLGVAYASAGRPDFAIPQYEAALRLSPGDAETHRNLGNAFGAEGMADLAIRHYEISLGLKPDQSEAHFRLGVVYLRQVRRADLARREFELALRIDPSDERARRMLHEMGVKDFP